ncbi:MotA/TolQ/ExbB proton channel family protein [Desulfocicer niacini]
MEIFFRVWNIIETGGPVMIPITLLSAWMWVLIIYKADWVRRKTRHILSVADALKCLESTDRIVPITDCPRAGILNFFLKNHFRKKTGKSGRSDQIFFEVAVRRQTRDFYRHIPTIMVLAAAAPLLGLLGTVTGMVETFRVIGLYGMGNSQAMASGIKEALMTTQAGLVVALPGLLVGQFMRKKIRAVHQDIMIFHRAVNQWLEKEKEKCTE